MESSDLKEQQTCLFQDDSFAEIGHLVHGSNGSPLGRAHVGVNRLTTRKASGFEEMLNRVKTLTRNATKVAQKQASTLRLISR